MFRPNDGWRLFFLTVLYGYVFLGVGWRLWYLPRIIRIAWSA